MESEVLDRTGPLDASLRKLLSPHDIAAALQVARRELGEDCQPDHLVAYALARLKRERERSREDVTRG